ncbi:uncharacterized protein BKA55DRAFT_598125 [Fusarium redolens]|uniref:F-box domain-containing protein n=1 Tax=Fusarium redolens TaxID=48865 RepID=A0A9P9JYY7_FUSRE|nr:uncharacterized protein BKA55DRAFT_598125 [Fusarium redolens]KAH7233939.1 hypothetical protein BKA55DRAFT_598125 [Fusarium redolens]
MDSLPVEVYWILARYLSTSDLSSLVRCSRLNRKRAQPLLYQTLQLNFTSGIVDCSTMLVLRTLSTNLQLGGIIAAWFCVSELVPARTWNLRNLDLNLCPGADRLIQRLLETKKLSSLKVLRFAGHLSRHSFLELLSYLGKTCELEELSLRLGGLSHLAGKSGAISSVHHTEVMANSNEADEPVRRLRSSLLENVMNHGKVLRLLVLDIREVIDQPQSCMRFDLYGVQKLIGSCPKIEFIGMPVNLQASGGQRYRRMNYEKNIHLSARQLKAFHLRGDYRPFSRTLNDAKHVSKPFRNRSDFEIFIGHYDKLRKVSFNLKGERKFLNVKEEEVKLYDLNL